VSSFDTIPHQELMQTLARRIVDADMLRLIRQWLKAPVETTGEDGRKRLEGGRASRQGVPQGGVISPLIANLYMNRFLKHWRQTGKGEAWKAHVINYADDFVSPAGAFWDISPLRGLILSRGHADEALAWTDRTMTRLGLTLNRTKTRLCEARTERFDFLGYSFGLHRFRQTGRRFIGASPSPKECATFEGQGGRNPGTGQHGTMGRGARCAEPLVAGMVRLLQPWLSLCRGPGDRSSSI
jgi:RNA-directed DNA polymerase